MIRQGVLHLRTLYTTLLEAKSPNLIYKYINVTFFLCKCSYYIFYVYLADQILSWKNRIAVCANIKNNLSLIIVGTINFDFIKLIARPGRIIKHGHIKFDVYALFAFSVFYYVRYKTGCKSSGRVGFGGAVFSELFSILCSDILGN